MTTAQMIGASLLLLTGLGLGVLIGMFWAAWLFTSEKDKYLREVQEWVRQEQDRYRYDLAVKNRVAANRNGAEVEELHDTIPIPITRP